MESIAGFGRAFASAMIGVLVFANWGAPNDWLFELADGTTLRAAVVKAPEHAAEAGAVYRVKVLEGPAAGTERDLPSIEVRGKTPLAGAWTTIWRNKWLATSAFAAAFSLILIFWFAVKWWKVVLAAAVVAVPALALPSGGLWPLIPFAVGVVALSLALGTSKGEGGDWFDATWTFAKQILPLLFFGVLVAGFLLGRPDHEGFIPSRYVEMLVGDNPARMLQITGWGGGAFESFARVVWPVWTNFFFFSVFGAFMYFATQTEVPILQGLIGAGMGKGPALALLLAGPALSGYIPAGIYRRRGLHGYRAAPGRRTFPRLGRRRARQPAEPVRGPVIE